MSCTFPSRLRFTPATERPPWGLFLFLTIVFFFSFHDLSYATKGIDNYYQSPDAMVTQVVEGSVPHRVALSLLGLVAVVSLVQYRSRRHFRMTGLLGWILLSFIVWIFISSTWTPDLALNLKKVLPFWILCIAAVDVGHRHSLRNIILWTFVSSGLFLLVGFTAEVAFGTFRPLASGYRFAGSLHPNAQGINCGLLLLSAVAAGHVKHRWRAHFWVCAFIGGLFLILTGSRTSLAAALIALAVYLLTLSSGRMRLAMALAISLAILFSLLFLGPELSKSSKTAILLGRGDPDSTSSFNGRTFIWSDLVYYARQRPLLGYGYFGFWTPAHIDVISEEEKQGVSSAHSTYIEYLLALGLVGAAMYTVSLLAGICRAFCLYRNMRDPTLAFCGALLVFCALAGILDSVIAVGSTLTFLLMAVLVRLTFVSPLD